MDTESVNQKLPFSVTFILKLLIKGLSIFLAIEHVLEEKK